MGVGQYIFVSEILGHNLFTLDRRIIFPFYIFATEFASQVLITYKTFTVRFYNLKIEVCAFRIWGFRIGFEQYRFASLFNDAFSKYMYHLATNLLIDMRRLNIRINIAHVSDITHAKQQHYHNLLS